MLMVIDIGNTNSVVGVFSGQKLLRKWRLASDIQRTADQYAAELVSLLFNAGYKAGDIEALCLSSVVPRLKRIFVELSRKYFSIDPIVVGPGVKTGIRISCDDPRSVGGDRIVNALACKEFYSCPGIVIDFGTATTFDVVGREGDYQGGIIAPGVLISAEALFARAALITSIDIEKPERLIGKNTRDAVLAGVYYGYASLVEGLTKRLICEVGDGAKVIATGGLAKLIVPEIKLIDEIVPDLTLQGLRLVAEYNA